MKRLIMVVIVASLLFSATVLAQPVMQQGKIHVVQAGQTLFSIARWYGLDVQTLAHANGILNPSYIYVGQSLVIPSASADAPVAVPAAGVYIVKPGDTLFSIARYYGLTAWTLANANGIYNLNHIYVGQRLVIPGGAPAVQPVAPKPVATTPAVAPVVPVASAAWRGEYYNGTEPTGGALFVRDDRAVNFQWGLRSPDTRLDTDQFSVHWSRTINYRGGLYRFMVTADDGVRLWLDGDLIIDEWHVQTEATYAVEVTLTPGNHVLAIDYFDESGVALIQFTFKRLGNAPVVPTATPDTTPDDDTGDADVVPPDAVSAYAWVGQYYSNAELQGAPVITRVDAQLAFEWGRESPSPDVPHEFFSVRWTRQVFFYEDNYAFCARADDGVRLYVGDDLIIDEWHGSEGYPHYCQEIDVAKGTHMVTVEYYDQELDALIHVWWERR